MKISVIVCTHNPRKDYLERTLDALRKQTLPIENWELLLIDNASNQPLIDKWDLSWHPHSRHIREDEQGLTPARLRGILESNGEILVFVDDDNLLSSDYLEESLGISHNYPIIGCWGAGIIRPEFELAPSPELAPYTSYLALRNIDQPIWGNSPKVIPIPWGAGLVVRKHIALAYNSIINKCSVRSKLDRSGAELNCGGDDEFSWVSYENGYGIGVFPNLKVIHLINKHRVEREYLIKLIEKNAYSHALLSYVHKQKIEIPKTPITLSDILNYFLRLRLLKTLESISKYIVQFKTSKISIAHQLARNRGIESAKKDLRQDLFK